MVSPVLITLFFASFAEAIESKKQTFLRPLTSYASLKESEAAIVATRCNMDYDLKSSFFEFKSDSIAETFGEISFPRETTDEKKENYLLRESCKGNRKLFANGEHPTMVQVDNMEDLLKNFDYGMRGGIRQVFTFVITDVGMFTVETDWDEELIDYLSKHVTLAGGAETVRMAGTFRFVHTGEEYKMVMDNDSGTYTPSKDGLLLTKELLRQHIHGLSIQVLDRMEPQPENTKHWVGPFEVPEIKIGEEVPPNFNERLAKFQEELKDNFYVAYQGKGWEWSP